MKLHGSQSFLSRRCGRLRRLADALKQRVTELEAEHPESRPRVARSATVSEGRYLFDVIVVDVRDASFHFQFIKDSSDEMFRWLLWKKFRPSDIKQVIVLNKADQCPKTGVSEDGVTASSELAAAIRALPHDTYISLPDSVRSMSDSLLRLADDITEDE